MAGKPKYDWPDDDQLVAAVLAAGAVAPAAEQMGIPRGTLDAHIRTRGLRERIQQARATALSTEDVGDPLDAQVRDLVRRKKRLSVEALSDQLDVAPRRIREALERLREGGYRIPDETAGTVELETVVPEKLNLHRSLLEGDEITFGLVSDTHLCSNEQALGELELAYDQFAERGITEVFHSGDLVAGVGIFRTQAAEILRHTFESQVDYAAEHYPQRAGMTTRIITGNHDIEGDFGKIGANPVVAVANRRDDIEFLGDYSAWVELPNGAWLHLLHGKGGMSYAYSYKAQKLVDGYPAGRKPAILAPGHWHVSGWIRQRGVHVLWPGCFEWKSKFLERLGLSPAVGFWIVTATLGDDGSLVALKPEWFEFHEGRVTAAAA